MESEKWNKWVYVQNRLTDKENNLMGTTGVKGMGRDTLGVWD